MRFNSKNGWTSIAFLGLLLATLAMQATNLPTASAVLDCACSAPTNVSVTGHTSSSASFTWDAVAGATGYEVWYVRLDDNYSSAHATVTSNSANFSGLAPGQYVFYVSTRCGDEASGIVILEDLLMG